MPHPEPEEVELAKRRDIRRLLLLRFFWASLLLLLLLLWLLLPVLPMRLCSSRMDDMCRDQASHSTQDSDEEKEPVDEPDGEPKCGP